MNRLLFCVYEGICGNMHKNILKKSKKLRKKTIEHSFNRSYNYTMKLVTTNSVILRDFRYSKGDVMSEEELKFLEIVDLKKGFGSGDTRQEVLRGMNFSVAKGEFCVLLGPSGSGKSTLLNIIGGIDNADSGYISINGDKLEEMDEKHLTDYRRKHLGYVFQMYNLIGNLNVKENIEVGAYLSDKPLNVDELLETLGLTDHKYKLPNQLSGGQQQRVSIGRALVKNPDILLCDEPTGALDYKTSKEILQLIEDVNKKYGNTIIMVTHNEAIKNMADHIIKLRDGVVRHNDINTNKIAAADLDW